MRRRHIVYKNAFREATFSGEGEGVLHMIPAGLDRDIRVRLLIAKQGT